MDHQHLTVIRDRNDQHGRSATGRREAFELGLLTVAKNQSNGVDLE
jgi:hypothetical protein